MAELNPTFVEAILSMARYGDMSPLLSGRRERRRFRAWCMHSPVATRVIVAGVYRHCFVGAPPSRNEPVPVSCAVAEGLVHRLVRAYENRALRRLVTRSRTRGGAEPPH